MIDLNNIEEIKKTDPKNVYGSTGMFADQCEQIWEDAKSVIFPPEFQNIQNIVLCGMGGSAYGGYVAQALFKEELSVPLVSNNDYTLPGFVNEKSLVFLSSFSGSTEEVISCLEKGLEKKAKLTGLTGGGKLSDMLQSNKMPALIFESKYNPSGQPRLGTGYMVLGIIALLNRAGLISISDEEVRNAVLHVRNNQEYIKEEAMELAKKLEGFIPVIFAAEFLSGNIHIMRNQFNETAKSFSAFSLLPELNHHLMEGLKNPADKKLKILCINSNLYSDKLLKRIELTKDVVSKNNIEFVSYDPKGSTKLAQVLEILSFGGYVSLYLALIYGQDPSVIPWVDYFKEKLS